MKKRIISILLILTLALSLLCSCEIFSIDCGGDHTDDDGDGVCDKCRESVITELDFFAINDLHGKLDDSDLQEGVDELTTFLKLKEMENRRTLVLSSGDMWQGSSESNLTKGSMMTDWMNSVGFSAMTLGNHEYDWGEEYIRTNSESAEFPFLAINVFDKATDTRPDYCSPSVLVSLDGVDVGIIGAIGDVYSSISADKVQDVYFKVGDELTELVIAESRSLREKGADVIIYSLHDGLSRSRYDGFTVANKEFSSYYDLDLSRGGYVDLVFEGHTHKSYCVTDSAGIYHLQGGGENDGISHAQIDYNTANGRVTVSEADYIPDYTYSDCADDPIVDELLKKYESEIAKAYELLGTNPAYLGDSQIESIVARLYYEFGTEKWGAEYPIALGGGFIKTRSPYSLAAGDVYYYDLQSLLPFDNEIVLCSVRGSDLLSKFFETNNSDYYIAYGEYGEELRTTLDPDAVYYIVTDMYTAAYAYNNLTVIEMISEQIYARDLFAEYIKSGGLDE